MAAPPSDPSCPSPPGMGSESVPAPSVGMTYQGLAFGLAWPNHEERVIPLVWLPVLLEHSVGPRETSSQGFASHFCVRGGGVEGYLEDPNM